MHPALKLLLSAGLITVATEFAKVNATLGGFIKSLPLLSLIAFVIMQLEGTSRETIGEVSRTTFWFVLPTLPMFLVFPVCLRSGWNFWVALAMCILGTGVLCALTFSLLKRGNVL